MWDINQLILHCEKISPFQLRVNFEHGRGKYFLALMKDPVFSNRITITKNSQKKMERKYSLLLTPFEFMDNFSLEQFWIDFIRKNENNRIEVTEGLGPFLCQEYKIPFEKFVELTLDVSKLNCAIMHNDDDDNWFKSDYDEEEEEGQIKDWDAWLRQEYPEFIKEYAGVFDIAFEEYDYNIRKISKELGFPLINPNPKDRIKKIQNSLIVEAEKRISQHNAFFKERKGLICALYFTGFSHCREILQKRGILPLLQKNNVPRLFTLETFKMLPQMPQHSIIVTCITSGGWYFDETAGDNKTTYVGEKAEALIKSNLEETEQFIQEYYEKNLHDCPHYDDIQKREPPPRERPYEQIPAWIENVFPMIRQIQKGEVSNHYAAKCDFAVFVKLRDLFFSNGTCIQDYSDLYLFTAYIIVSFLEHRYIDKEERPIEISDLRFVLEYPETQSPKTRYDVSDLRGLAHYQIKRMGYNKIEEMGLQLSPLEEWYRKRSDAIEFRPYVNNLFERYLEYAGANSAASLRSLLALIDEKKSLPPLTGRVKQKIISAAMQRFDLESAAEAVRILFPAGAQNYDYIPRLLAVQREFLEHNDFASDFDISGSYRAYIYHIARQWELISEKILTTKFGKVASVISGDSRLINNKVPDFILHPSRAVRSANGLIKSCDIIVDAKKSIMAISDDIELYGPFCKELWFLILDDNVRYEFRDPKVKCIYAADVLNSWRLPTDLAAEVRAHYDYSMAKVEGFKMYLNAASQSTFQTEVTAQSNSEEQNEPKNYL